MRALGDWHADHGRWQQAAERFGSLVRVNQLDDLDVTSRDQLRLAAALLEAGDRAGYEQWRQNLVARITPTAASVSPSIVKACLLRPAESSVLQWLAAASEVSANRSWRRSGNAPPPPQAVAWSDAKVLLGYRRGDFPDKTIRQKFLADSAPRLASFSLIQTMAAWQLKDYWGAMITWTKGYALIEAGARQGQVTFKVATQIFPGISEPDYLQAPWYDWAVADLLLRECGEMIGQAEQSVGTRHGQAPRLEDLAIMRAAGGAPGIAW